MKNFKPTTLLILTLTFVIPLVAAWFAYSKGMFISGKTTNHGTLIIPAIDIKSLALRDAQNLPVVNHLHGKWWLLYLTANPQDPLAQRNLYYMRQIRQATGKNRDRVARAIVTTGATPGLNQWLNSHYPDTSLLIISPEKIAELQITTKKLALLRGSLYLVDPLGNIMMLYSSDAAPKGILKDLERVLKVSQIG